MCKLKHVTAGAYFSGGLDNGGEVTYLPTHLPTRPFVRSFVDDRVR